MPTLPPLPPAATEQASCEKLHFDQHAAFTSLCFLELHLTPTAAAGRRTAAVRSARAAGRCCG
ncbi:MAG: hypothetical protein ACLVJH_08405 [Faecalibacterium prausnitzii]